MRKEKDRGIRKEVKKKRMNGEPGSESENFIHWMQRDKKMISDKE